MYIGEDNPPFSCSTPQSAILAFQSKVNGFLQCSEPEQYCGDVQVEKLHGTNITGSSLVKLTEWYMNTKKTTPLESDYSK